MLPLATHELLPAVLFKAPHSAHSLMNVWTASTVAIVGCVSAIQPMGHVVYGWHRRTAYHLALTCAGSSHPSSAVCVTASAVSALLWATAYASRPAHVCWGRFPSPSDSLIGLSPPQCSPLTTFDLATIPTRSTLGTDCMYKKGLEFIQYNLNSPLLNPFSPFAWTHLVWLANSPGPGVINMHNDNVSFTHDELFSYSFKIDPPVSGIQTFSTNHHPFLSLLVLRSHRHYLDDTHLWACSAWKLSSAS